MKKLISLYNLERCVIDDLRLYNDDVLDVRFNLNYKTGKIVTTITLDDSGTQRDIHFYIDQLNLCDLGDRTEEEGITRVVTLVRDKALDIIGDEND